MQPPLYDSSLVKNGCGYVLLPIRLPEAWELYKSAEAAFWTAEDVLYQPVPANYRVNATLATRLCEMVAGMRAAALPENMSVMIRDPEIACFLSFQAMQENIHLETAASLALPSGDVTGGDITPLGWPEARPPYADNERGLFAVLEHAATYASITATLGTFAQECVGDPLLADAVKRISRDYGRSYEFSVVLCAIVCGGPDTDLPTFLDAARGIVDLVTMECDLSAPLKTSVSDEFIDDLRTAFETIPFRDTKKIAGGDERGQGTPAEARDAQQIFSTDEPF